jgi:hypothetical protein
MNMATSNANAAAKRASEVAPSRVLINGVKAVADIGVLPGASLLAEGDIKSGTLHVVAGVLARSLFGPIGWVAVGADALSLSVTGRHLHQHFFAVEKVNE